MSLTSSFQRTPGTPQHQLPLAPQSRKNTETEAQAKEYHTKSQGQDVEPVKEEKSRSALLRLPSRPHIIEAHIPGTSVMSIGHHVQDVKGCNYNANIRPERQCKKQVQDRTHLQMVLMVATWTYCNLNFFIHIQRLLAQRFHGHRPLETFGGSLCPVLRSSTPT